MHKAFLFAAGMALATITTTSAMAQSMDKMFGKWKWQGFVVECAKGGDFGISCKVKEGPQNVGMEMVMSKIEMKDGAYVGKIRHPANKKVYNTKMTMPDENSWKLDGCTDDGACASGVFVRVK